MKTLRELLEGIEFSWNQKGSLALPIQRIISDSRQAQKGDLFVALKGSSADGHQYIQQAIQKGVSAVISEKEEGAVSSEIPYLQVKNSHRVFCSLLSHFHNLNLSDIGLIGITGTNGKTTTAYLVFHLLNALSSCGLIGTIEYAWRDKKIKAVNTTPGQDLLIPILGQMASEKVRYCVSEISSHALDQERVAGLAFAVALFTNLTQDHMDYHQNFENYYQAKKKLFTNQPESKHRIVNVDDSFGKRLAGELTGDVLTYGLHSEAEAHISNVHFNLLGSEFTIRYQKSVHSVKSHLPLFHNVYNVTAALLIVSQLGFSMEEALRCLSTFSGIPGRMERVDEGQPFYVFVDYAHTPDAFQNVFSSVQGMTKGRVISVFGCGGDRDTAKRPLMGKIASQFSDILFLTDDNPRTEDAALIRRDIRAGIKTLSHSTVLEVADRREAIFEALSLAQPGDLVLILGKGHEREQIVGRKTFPFSDVEVAREVLKQQTKVEIK